MACVQAISLGIEGMRGENFSCRSRTLGTILRYTSARSADTTVRTIGGRLRLPVPDRGHIWLLPRGACDPGNSHRSGLLSEGVSDMRLGEELHHSGISIRCAQIARAPKALSTSGTGHGLPTRPSSSCSPSDLASAVCITDVIPFDDAPCLKKGLAERRWDAIQVVFQPLGATTASGAGRPE
jgi:hypothetical protein